MKLKTPVLVLTFLTLMLMNLGLPLPAHGSAQAEDFAPGKNLIINGGFEQGFTGWNIRGCAACSSISSTEVYSGAHSYLVDTTASSTGSLIWQPIPEISGDFVLRAFVYAEQGANILELVRDWNPPTGSARFVTEVWFANPATGAVRVRAWDTMVLTDFVWPSQGWHELKIVANESKKRQSFFIDGLPFATVHTSTVFLPETIIMGDVRGVGWQSRYVYDAVGLRDRPSTHSMFLPLVY